MHDDPLRGRKVIVFSVYIFISVLVYLSVGYDDVIMFFRLA